MLLFAVRCALFAASCVFVGGCLLIAVSWLLCGVFAARGAAFVVACCVLYVVVCCASLCVVRCVLFRCRIVFGVYCLRHAWLFVVG